MFTVHEEYKTRRRRFSAEEIRRQPEFRSIALSLSPRQSTMDTDGMAIGNSKWNQIGDTRRSSSCTKRCPRRSSSVKNVGECGMFSCNVGGATRDNIIVNGQTLGKGGVKHDAFCRDKFGGNSHEDLTRNLGHLERNKEESFVIVKKDEDMGISVFQKQHNPQLSEKAISTGEETTPTSLICFQLNSKKKDTKVQIKNKSDGNNTSHDELLRGDDSYNQNGVMTTHKQHQHEFKGKTLSPIFSHNDDNSNIIGRDSDPTQENELDSQHLLHTESQSEKRQRLANTTSKMNHQIKTPDTESHESKTHTFRSQAKKVVNAIHFQNILKNEQLQHEEIDKKLERQMSSAGHRQYDAKLEKSAVYLRSRSRTFTRATQCMQGPKSSLRQLNVHYSQTNSCHNNRIIFTDLLKSSHVQNAIIADGVFAMERRLYNRRHDRSRSTTFYDRVIPLPKGSAKQRPHSSPLPQRPQDRKGPPDNSVARTVAEKKKERKERIHKKDELIEYGYVPKMSTLDTLGPEVIEEILSSCRHLRVRPDKQPWLYTND